MRKKYLATAALTLALAAGSAMTSFAAGFVSTSQGMKYQWGSGDYCTNNWVNYKNHWFFFGADQIMRTGRKTGHVIMRPIQASFRAD